MGKNLFGNIHPATGGGFDAAETGVALDVDGYDLPVGVLVSGTFVGTIKIEVSIDGTNWAEYASVTVPGVTKVEVPVKQVRARCSAYTSGLAVVQLGAMNADGAF